MNEKMKDIICFIQDNKIIKEIVDERILKKYEYDGYFNISSLYQTRLIESSDELKVDLNKIKRLASKREPDLIFRRIISAVVYNSHELSKTQAIKMFVKAYIDESSANDENSEYDEEENYVRRRNVDIHVITSLWNYLEIFTGIYKSDDIELFFRGHSDANYILLPSILRENRIYEKEQYFYNYITRTCPKYFDAFRSHIDRLVEMQHYELPTRLLDVSKNSLVALLFACFENHKKDAEVIVFSEQKTEIKYGQSDTLSILSCLPSLSSDEKSKLLDEVLVYQNRKNLSKDEIDLFNSKPIVQHLLHEIKTEKPAFKDIILPSDIQKVILALPAMHNNRIIRQSGAFIITGLVDYIDRKEISDKLNKKRIRDEDEDVTPIYIVNGNSKKEIKEQLEICDLNEATLFPEIDAVARYLKKQF